METNNIFTLLEEVNNQIRTRPFSVIELDLVKKHLLECYELTINNNATTTIQTSITKMVSSETSIPAQEKNVANEEINPFIAEIEEVKPSVIAPPHVETKQEPKHTQVNDLSFTAKTEETESINDHFEQEGSSLNDKFQLSINKGLNEKTSQGDLKKSIDFNRQFVFIQELFNNDATAYMKAIEHLNNCATLEDAFAYLNKEVVHFYKWRPELQSVKLFEKLVRQKFGV